MHPRLFPLLLLGACLTPSADPIPQTTDFAFVEVQLQG